MFGHLYLVEEREPKLVTKALLVGGLPLTPCSWVSAILPTKLVTRLVLQVDFLNSLRSEDKDRLKWITVRLRLLRHSLWGL